MIQDGTQQISCLHTVSHDNRISRMKTATTETSKSKNDMRLKTRPYMRRTTKETQRTLFPPQRCPSLPQIKTVRTMDYREARWPTPRTKTSSSPSNRHAKAKRTDGPSALPAPKVLMCCHTKSGTGHRDTLSQKPKQHRTSRPLSFPNNPRAI